MFFFIFFFCRTVYIHGFNNLDFSLWHSAIILAAGTGSKALSEQQLTKNGIPIILESCIAFVTQYGKLNYMCCRSKRLKNKGKICIGRTQVAPERAESCSRLTFCITAHCYDMNRDHILAYFREMLKVLSDFSLSLSLDCPQDI